MKDLILRLQGQFQKYWQGLNAQQRVLIAVFSLVILGSLVAISFYAGRTDYAPLFTNLGPEDASAIVVKLRETRVQFQLADGGKTIKVPAKSVYETRISLAGQGLPQGGGVGFEIFDKNFLGMTEFTQRLNFQRALQGELERTIRQISAVEQARVHLVLPEKELYTEKEKEPSASVILKLKPSARIEKGQIKAILNLVKTSVEGLKENNISVIDTNGTLLSRSYDEDQYAFTSEIVSSQYELKKQLETHVESQVASMLARILGPGRAVVRATVEIDLAKKEATEETYVPIEGMKEGGILRSQQKKSEYFKGTGSTAGVGVPGATTNIGNVPGYQQTSSSGGSSDYTKDESVANYEINKKVAHSISTPGEIKRLSVAVLLDGNLPAEKINTIKQAVSSGIGLNQQRGDQIVVETVDFDKTYLEQEKKEMDKLATKELISSSVKTASVIFVTIIILLFAVSMIRHQTVVRKAAEEVKRAKEVAAIPVPGQTRLADVITSTGLAAGSKEPELNKQLEVLAREKPKEVAEALKNWISGT